MSEKSDKKASDILKACIEDIDNGLWICGILDKWEKSQGVGNPKHMGCAIGLVSINSGLTFKGTHTVFAQYPSVVELDNPGSVPTEVRESVKYLARNIPDAEARETSSNLFRQETAVIRYNDEACHSPENAKKWFTGAYLAAVKDGK